MKQVSKGNHSPNINGSGNQVSTGNNFSNTNENKKIKVKYAAGGGIIGFLLGIAASIIANIITSVYEFLCMGFFIF